MNMRPSLARLSAIALSLGVAVAGLGIAAAPAEAHGHISFGIGLGPWFGPPVYYAPPPVYYAPAPVYYAPAYQPEAQAPAYDNSNCQPYHTTAVVGGVSRPISGMACQQPDGSWRMSN